MKLGIGLYRGMFTPDNVRFAKQIGATHIVAHMPGHFVRDDQNIITSDSANIGFGVVTPHDPLWTYEGLRDLKAMINAEGLELEALENFAPDQWYDVLLDGPRKHTQLEQLKRILRDMGRVGIPIMGYNFSIAGVWGRVEGPFARGGAVSVGFENPVQTPIPNGMVWNMVYDPAIYDAEQPHGTVPEVSSAQLWKRFAAFLQELLPVAEEAGVKLALHPDDPPMPTLRGTARLVHRPDGYQRMLDLHPSPANTMEFCIGTLSEMPDSDIYQVVDHYSRTGRIAYIHFRNVQGKVPTYHETFVDEGDTDMLRVLRILHTNGYNGVLIPDHTPLIECAAPWHAGIAYALGYMKAALAMIEQEQST
ncbi:MAG: mannonate dehydratase [Herpetosiphonaceae bacterium]|nr:mannonate dehydratase [Herpetosiphonaceae bacterium]